MGEQKKSKSFFFAFVHVPVYMRYNNNIRDDLLKLLNHMRSQGQKYHRVEAKTETIFTRGYTGVRKSDCKKGIHFPFNKFDVYEMTMKNTPMDLDILYLDEENKIIRIAKGKAGV